LGAAAVGIIAAHVAAACATIVGWIRISGQVTPVPSRSCSVSRAILPITLQTNALSPWRSIQGWKWSETSAKVNPASPAMARSYLGKEAPETVNRLLTQLNKDLSRPSL
jgi:hypothetical protein